MPTPTHPTHPTHPTYPRRHILTHLTLAGGALLTGLATAATRALAASPTPSTPSTSPASPPTAPPTPSPDSPTHRFLQAILSGDEPTVRSALTADPGLLHARDTAGRSAFALALLHRHAGIASLLRESGYRPDAHEAALALDWEAFDALTADSPGLANRDHPIGGTAMVAAALGGAGTSIWHVYAQGGRPDESPRGADGISAIRAAFDFPDLSVAELTAASLLSNGADPNVPQRLGSSALHAAASRGSFELAEMLLRKNADPAARDAEGRTPRDLALAAGHTDVAALLAHPERVPRDHSTSRRAYDASGAPYSPPDLAAYSILERGRVVGVSHTNFDALRQAIDRAPALVHSVATTTEGAVEASAHMGRRDMVDYLLDRGAPCSLPTAVMRGDLARAKALLAEDPDRVRERGPHDFALLWYPVIGGGLTEMAELLFDHGADVQQQHWLGTTALHYAATGGDVDLGKLLIEKGADVNRAGRKFGGKTATPLQLAESRGRDAFARLLRDHGARR